MKSTWARSRRRPHCRQQQTSTASASSSSTQPPTASLLPPRHARVNSRMILSDHTAEMSAAEEDHRRREEDRLSMLLPPPPLPRQRPTQVEDRRLGRLARQCSALVQLFLLHSLIPQCSAVRENHYVHWNTSNPIFRIDNTDHIIDVNRGNQPWEYDQVNIICPLYERGTRPDLVETYIIYSVNKEEFDSCRISNPNPRVIAQCTKPHQLMYFTITFRSFTPTPGGMEFRPGQDYYFISTSAKGDVHRRIGGKCSTHNMRVQFKVANNNHEATTSSPSSSPPRAINIPRRSGSEKESRGQSSSSTERSDVMHGFREKLPRYYGDLSYYANRERDSADDEYYVEDLYYRQHNKKSGQYPASHPNDVIKHEASRMAAAGASGSRTMASAPVTLLILSFLTLLVPMTLRKLPT